MNHSVTMKNLVFLKKLDNALPSCFIFILIARFRPPVNYKNNKFGKNPKIFCNFSKFFLEGIEIFPIFAPEIKTKGK